MPARIKITRAQANPILVRRPRDDFIAEKNSALIANASRTIGAARRAGGNLHAEGVCADSGTLIASATFVPAIAGVTGFGVNLQVAPAGKPVVQASVTGPPASPAGSTGRE